MSDSEMEKIEVMSNEEVRFQRSEFASVIFHNVADTYPVDAHVECSYSLTQDIIPSSRDWVGIYKVGWMSPRDYIYYEWAPIPKNYEQGKEAEATILFQAHTLPNDDGEFYQFCYVSSAGQIRGASTPFQFKKPSAGDFIEVEDDDTDMLIIRSRTIYLQENLKKKEDENRDLVKYRDTMAKEVTGLADKITGLQKKLEKSEKEKKDVQKLLESNQNKLDEMLSDANDMTLVHDELRSKVDEKDKEKLTLEEKITRLKDNMGSLQVKLKVLQSEKDELEGQNRTLMEEMDLYKNHLSKSETSVSSYVHEIESLTSRLEESGKHVTDLTGKIERHEVDLTKCREEIVHLKAALHQEKTRVEEQHHVTMSEKENVSTLTEKLRNVEDKLATEENTKDLMRQELNTFRDAQKKMSLDLEASKSECHRMKSQISRMEDDFTQENTVLKSENVAIHSDLQKLLKEKEILQAKLCTLQDEMTKIHESNEGSEGPIFALNQANVGLQNRLTSLNERYSKLLEEKKQSRVREIELHREVADLKDRIHMCSEEYKHIYKENRKLQKKIDKLLGHRRWRDSRSESEKVTVETVQTSTERSTPERKSLGDIHGSAPTNVLELQTHLASQKAKKDHYKQLYREEKERLETLRQCYHENLHAKEAEIQRLTKLVSVRDTVADTGEKDQKLRSLEKYLDEKQKMIDELNQKLRDFKMECEAPKPAKRSNIPKKTETDSASCTSKDEDGGATPKLIYGNPFKEESKKLTLQEQAVMGTQLSGSYPNSSEAISPPESQHMNRCDDVEEVFVDACPCLPKPREPDQTTEFVDAVVCLPQPLQPEQTTEARLAAVKALMPSSGMSDELDGHCYGIPLTRAGIVPTAPPDSDGDDIVVKVSSGRWLIDANGESRQCPRCPVIFPAEMKEEDFLEHVLGHMGRICPVCKMQVDDSMETKEFEYHVHCCIGQRNSDD